ncbi:AraC family transcriptional regulator [Nonomuraea polychroma]|uniref:AraC family transcriptional regulator n=1 Tax=Nonomuraea polychroma TaxID=46176 RepID=A0A438M213_9ACTN|nr:helix-turn-helix domain-containing protein [Nonomuraea polychroma]RVX39804.1 AraC family transcriptional regulator [Nonomuraea polychroma]
MPIERRQDGTLVYGYLDTPAHHGVRASDAVLVRDEGRPYQAEMRPYRFGMMGACEFTSDDPVRVRSLPSPSVPDGEYLLSLLRSGRGRLEQDGRLASLSPGEFMLYAGGRPFRLELDGPYRYFLMRIPATVDRLFGTACDVTANREILRLPSARILAAMLTEMADQAPGLGPLAGRELGEHVTAMLGTVLRESSRPDPPGDGAALLARILDHIDQHLGDDLLPGTIAAAHHVSPRYLHKLFEQQGQTVGEHVRRRRLERIRQDLGDPALAQVPVQAIAGRWGLKDPSHFSKLFRSEYGISPREFRREVISQSGARALRAGR